MAVTSVHVLREAQGQKTVDGDGAEVQFVVITNDASDGPKEVLSVFPVGNPMSAYLGASKTLVEGYAPPSYIYPYPLTKCDGNQWDITSKFINELMVLTSATIVSRDYGGKSKTRWVVAGRFQSSERDEGAFSPPTVEPYYSVEQKEILYAQFRGWNKRIGLDDPNACDPMPGEWVEVDWEGVGGGVFAGQVSKDGDTKIVPFTNSAGFRFTEPQTVRHATPSFRVSWFSYTALDFSCAIGKVNKNKYQLKAYDRPPVPSSAPPAFQSVHKPYLVFNRCFNERELLIANVESENIRWGGANNYKYTIEFTYDPDGHDRYILDSGYSALARSGDPTAQGSRYPSDGDEDSGNDPGGPKASRSGTKTQTHTGKDGVPSQDESLLNGDGQFLQTTSGDTLNDAVFLRFRVNEGIQFPDYKEITETNMYHEWDPLAPFPFLMDGGSRYNPAQPLPPWFGQECEDTSP